MSECIFCGKLLEKKTEWFYWDVINQVVVCRDLHDREYRYRLLVVGYGKSWHRPWDDYAKAEKDYLIKVLNGVAIAHVQNGAKLANIDTEHFLINFHGHAQVGML